MRLLPLSQIALELGLEHQELCTLSLRLFPNPCVVRNGVLYADLDRVIYALDRNGITFPNDHRPVADYHPGDVPFLLSRSSHPRLAAPVPAEVLGVSPSTPTEGDDQVHEVEVESPRRATPPPQPGRTGNRKPLAPGDEPGQGEAQGELPDSGARQKRKRQSRRRP